ALGVESVVFRWLGVPARALAGLIAANAPAAMKRLSHDLDLFDKRYWRAEEFAAAKTVESVPALALLAGLAACYFEPSMALAVGLLGLFVVPMVLLYDLRSKARAYVTQARDRLPFTLDLMTLVLEAGAGTLPVCIERAASENGDHPLGVEFRRVLTGLEQGAAQAQLLNELDRRLADPDVRELVATLNTAEERGIPLRDALRSQAERMRKRQVQWLEKSAEEAKVHITWPALVVMLACLLIIAAPMLLPAVVVGSN
ncbi:MAG: type II secretion system F family protein, partial [Gemmataceae bacterium]|nr:type II secretion system F family protein [Gemmataceae bacterium]